MPVTATDGSLTIACDEIVFNLAEAPVAKPRVTFYVTNNLGQGAEVFFWAGLNGNWSGTLGSFFSFDGPITYAQSRGEIKINPKGTVPITLTFLLAAHSPPSTLPSQLRIALYCAKKQHQLVYIPIRYDVRPAVPDRNDASCDPKCTQCKSRAYYICRECEPHFHLCLLCAERGARECHLSRFGEGHELEFDIPGNECSACQEKPGDIFYICNYCETNASGQAILCQNCYADYENISQHTSRDGAIYTFRRTNSHPTILQSPVPYYHQKNEKILCDICKGRIRIDFMRCTTCIKSYNLCDRCADEGGIGSHRLHTFEYLVPVVGKPPSQPGADRESNPESAG